MLKLRQILEYCRLLILAVPVGPYFFENFHMTMPNFPTRNRNYTSINQHHVVYLLRCVCAPAIKAARKKQQLSRCQLLV